jgi:hypothetical protein
VACRDWRHAFSLLLTAVEEAGYEEQHREHEGEFRVSLRVDAELSEPVTEPDDTSDKPDPGRLSHG